MDILVTYDIDTTTPAGERRLTKVAKVCEGFGRRVQKSVFECRLGPTDLERFKIALIDEMDRSIDSVNIYKFDGSLPDARTCLGRPPLHELGKPWIL